MDKLCLSLTQSRIDGSVHGNTTVVRHLILSVEQLLEALPVKDSMVLDKVKFDLWRVIVLPYEHTPWF